MEILQKFYYWANANKHRKKKNGIEKLKTVSELSEKIVISNETLTGYFLSSQRNP